MQHDLQRNALESWRSEAPVDCMELTVDGRKTNARPVSTVGELILALKLNGEEVLVKVNGKLAPNGMKIAATDEIKVMRVIFGG